MQETEVLLRVESNWMASLTYFAQLIFGQLSEKKHTQTNLLPGLDI